MVGGKPNIRAMLVDRFSLKCKGIYWDDLAYMGPPTPTTQINHFGPRRPADPPRNVRLLGGFDPT